MPDLEGGEQRLDVRFIQFDNVVIELLQYRDAEQPMGSGDSFAEPRDHMSPAYPRSMHICFYIRDDVDFNKFIRDLEAEIARRGMTQVKANRVITVRTEQERLAAPMERQHQQDHRRQVERLVADLLQGAGGRAARVRSGARAREEDVRRRLRRAQTNGGGFGALVPTIAEGWS